MPVRRRLFLALLPPPDARGRLAAMRDALGGRGVADDRPLATLFTTDEHSALPPDLATRAIRATCSTPRAAVPILLDTLVATPKRALLSASEVSPTLRLFQLALQRDLKRAGVLPLAGHRFDPHCTLAYGGHAPGTRTVDPTGWTATEFVPIHSLIGRHEHRILARWPLAGG